MEGGGLKSLPGEYQVLGVGWAVQRNAGNSQRGTGQEEPERAGLLPSLLRNLGNVSHLRDRASGTVQI